MATDGAQRPRGRPPKPASERLSERRDIWADPVLAARMDAAGADEVRRVLREGLPPRAANAK